MRLMPASALAVAAVIAFTGSAQHADASVRVTATPRVVNPGAGVVITARVTPRARAERRAYRCRVLMTGPFGERQRLGSRPARRAAPARWRTRIPPATHGHWQAEVVCPGAGAGVARVVARIVQRPPQITAARWRYVDASQVWTWAARVANSSHAYDLQGVRVTASFRDASGRLVATDVTPDMILPRSSAGWIGGEVDMRDAPPPGTTLNVTGTGIPFPFRKAPFRVADARATFDPGVAGSVPSLVASARVRNPNRSQLGLGRVYAVALDPAGALLRARWRLAFVGLPPGGTLEVDSGFFGDEALPGARVEWFPAITPTDPPTQGGMLG